ncbi:MAG: class I SAM-dependent methyltransferase [Sphaerochaetaceae bacterium]|nr:class I SAM-dependent methyltransferase [Sphaerochaetaceae bacterium]
MAPVPYDIYYQDENYFGDPYPGLRDFFDTYPHKGHVLDLGCGQGRDSLHSARTLHSARQGFTVTGIDISQVGLDQLSALARSEELDVMVLHADIHSWDMQGDYDIILLDSMLHFNRKDIPVETALVRKVADKLGSGGILVNFMIAGARREKYLKKILDEQCPWNVLYDDYTDYPDFNATYHRYIAQKV